MPSNSDFPPAIEVKRITADAVIMAGTGKIWGASIMSTTAESSIKIHNDEDAADAATIVLEVGSEEGAATGPSVSCMLPRPVDVAKAYANITGSGAVAYIYFQAAATYKT